MTQYTYLLINSLCFLSTFVFSFYKKRAFYKDWKYFFPANLLVAFVFLIWDHWFTRLGVWGFNPDYLIGIYILSLPLEEVLFFICIPYSCTFLFFSITYLIKKNPMIAASTNVTYGIIALLAAVSFFNYDKLYTFTTCLSTALFLSFCLIKKIDLSFIYLSYLFIIPFFLISNGILTGSIVKEPIVWYNNIENLNIRLFTIPIEDSVYGFLLISLNILLFQYLKTKGFEKDKSNIL